MMPEYDLLTDEDKAAVVESFRGRIDVIKTRQLDHFRAVVAAKLGYGPMPEPLPPDESPDVAVHVARAEAFERLLADPDAKLDSIDAATIVADAVRARNDALGINTDPITDDADLARFPNSATAIAAREVSVDAE